MNNIMIRRSSFVGILALVLSLVFTSAQSGAAFADNQGTKNTCVRTSGPTYTGTPIPVGESRNGIFVVTWHVDYLNKVVNYSSRCLTEETTFFQNDIEGLFGSEGYASEPYAAFAACTESQFAFQSSLAPQADGTPIYSGFRVTLDNNPVPMVCGPMGGEVVAGSWGQIIPVGIVVMRRQIDHTARTISISSEVADSDIEIYRDYAFENDAWYGYETFEQAQANAIGMSAYMLMATYLKAHELYGYTVTLDGQPYDM